MFNAYIVFVNYNNPYVHQVPDKRRGGKSENNQTSHLKYACIYFIYHLKPFWVEFPVPSNCDIYSTSN